MTKGFFLIRHRIEHLRGKTRCATVISSKDTYNGSASKLGVEVGNSSNNETIQRKRSLRRRPVRSDVPPGNILKITKLGREGIQGGEKLQKTLGSLTMHDLKSPALATVNFPENKKGGKDKSEKRPASPFAVKKNNILTRKPVVTDTEKMLDK